MKKRKLIYVLLAGLAFTACSNEDQAVQQPQKQSRPLTIEVTENPLVQDGEEGSNSNRAAITTTSDLTAFKLDYVYTKNETKYTNGEGNAYSATNTSGTWTTTGGWPETGDNNTEVNWYAYSEGTFNLTDATPKLPYINFTVEESAASQKDLLVAKASGTYSGTGGNLSFTFDHACAALRFWVKKSTNLNDYTLNISEVVLCNVVKQAKYYYGTGWNDLSSDRSVYTLYSGSAQTLGSADYIAMDGGTPSYLFLIPQTLTPWDHITDIVSATTQTYLKVKCTITKNSDSQVVYNDSYAYVPFGTSFAAGTKYDVKINIGKNSLYSGPNTKIID